MSRTRAVWNPGTSVVEAARSAIRVNGLTHSFYRYPARFNPEFVRAVIRRYTKPGDVVLDPFMGGGTTAVEALALGRRFIGADVSPISRFLALAKTTPLSAEEGSLLAGWVDSPALRASHAARSKFPMKRDGRLENVPWWLGRHVLDLVKAAEGLPSRKLTRIARAAILRTSQWALDNRRVLASTRQFCRIYSRHLLEMTSQAQALDSLLARSPNPPQPRPRLFCRRATGIEQDARIPSEWKPVRLVLTSPPYPGVHVLYHRWQVRGRRETGMPFWIVGKEDGHPASFYTMGPRYARDLAPYLTELQASFKSIASLMDGRSAVVQLIGFSDPGSQFGPVLDALEAAGLEAVGDLGTPHAMLWRSVPNRKWYNAPESGAMAAQEALLVHRLGRFAE